MTINSIFTFFIFFRYRYIVTYTISPTRSFLIGVGLSMTYDMVLVEESPSAETEKFTRIAINLSIYRTIKNIPVKEN